MKKQSRRKFSADFKAKVALEAVKNQQTLVELAVKFDVNPVMISKWKAEFLENMAAAFEKKDAVEKENVDTQELYVQIGQLKVENEIKLLTLYSYIISLKRMTTISKENNYLTFINIFKVNSDNQQKLIDLLIEANQTVKEQPGFISSSLHKSLDGEKVTMYAQWESIDHYNSMRNNAAASPFLSQALEIASFEPGMYEVVETFTASAS